MQSLHSAVVLKEWTTEENSVRTVVSAKNRNTYLQKKGQSSTNDTAKGKVKVVSVHAIKAYREWRYSSTHS